MQYSKRKHNAALAMPDSDKKLSALESVGLSFGIFDKQSIIDECARLRGLGYKNLAERWLERQ
jgi:hypothetical protein